MTEHSVPSCFPCVLLVAPVSYWMEQKSSTLYVHQFWPFIEVARKAGGCRQEIYTSAGSPSFQCRKAGQFFPFAWSCGNSRFLTVVNSSSRPVKLYEGGGVLVWSAPVNRTRYWWVAKLDFACPPSSHNPQSWRMKTDLLRNSLSKYGPILQPQQSFPCLLAVGQIIYPLHLS